MPGESKADVSVRAKLDQNLLEDDCSPCHPRYTTLVDDRSQGPDPLTQTTYAEPRAANFYDSSQR